MRFFTESQLSELHENFHSCENSPKAVIEQKPVVKLEFEGDVWLISQVDPDDPNSAFGFSGSNSPSTISRVSDFRCIDLQQLEEKCGLLGVAVEADPGFVADKSIGEYIVEARRLGYILW